MTVQTQLSTFSFEQSSIRIIAVNGEPWFVAKDICSSLNISNVTDALIKLDDDEKMILDNTLGLTESISKQVQELNLVSESGMYTLILRCRDAVKKGSVPHRFRKWVTAEVLPQIRKTGAYAQAQLIDNPQNIVIPYAGRWLVITNEYDPERNIIKNIDGMSCISAALYRQLASETRQVAELLSELSSRLRISEGYNQHLFKIPLLETAGTPQKSNMFK